MEELEEHQYESYRAQLRVLQLRIIAHGNRFWQLPFSYAGVVAITFGQSKIADLGIWPEVGLIVFGLLLIWLLSYSRKRYEATAKHMQSIEQKLQIEEATDPNIGFFPYFLIVVLGISVSIFSLVSELFVSS